MRSGDEHVHQYVERKTGRVRTEKFFSDQAIRTIYSELREKAPVLFRLCVSSRISSLLGWLNYDLPFGSDLTGARNTLRELGVDLWECVRPPAYYSSHRRIFERQIRYWECRPMPEDKNAIVSPADSRMIVGSLDQKQNFFIKHKFFTFEELLGTDKKIWLDCFQSCDFAIFRLTPEKYHYNHAPVSGRVLDIYEIGGAYHSCNPGAVVEIATPFSKNKRVVTILDTDVPGGTGCGLVAMIEVVALMIGRIEQAYSLWRYENPIDIRPAMMLRKGQPKSLYRPGSSLDILMFESGKVRFDRDIVENVRRKDVRSRFSSGFKETLAETEVQVRMSIAQAVGQAGGFRDCSLCGRLNSGSGMEILDA